MDQARVDESVAQVSRLARVALRPEEAADTLGISRAKLFELLAQGQIRSIKIGRARRVPLAELHSWVAGELERQST
jgi:excisionase family DNA binding protein